MRAVDFGRGVRRSETARYEVGMEFPLCSTGFRLSGVGTLALAHVGDAVFDLYVRTHLCHSGVVTARRLHTETTRHVRAGAQALYAQQILPLLTPEEDAVFRRGRNTELGHIPASCTREDYQMATAFETLLGHLFLSGQNERLQALMAALGIHM